MEIQLEEWLSRADDPPEVFLAQLRDFTLDTWDHYTHLRIAYILLSQHGRREGMKLIFRDIKSFIENSPRTRRGGSASAGAQAGDAAGSRGTTFHETMTYFWVHMVHYAMESSHAPAEAMKNMGMQLYSSAVFDIVNDVCCCDVS
jgi:ADP-ribosylation factor protein 1